jgi:hypothetical protein
MRKMAPISLEELKKRKENLLEIKSGLKEYLGSRMNRNMAYSESEVYEFIEMFLKKRAIEPGPHIKGYLLGGLIFDFLEEHTSDSLISGKEVHYYTLK